MDLKDLPVALALTAAGMGAGALMMGAFAAEQAVKGLARFISKYMQRTRS
jgi:hypothetical protein